MNEVCRYRRYIISILKSLLGIARPGVSLYLFAISTKYKKKQKIFALWKSAIFTEGLDLVGAVIKVPFELVILTYVAKSQGLGL